MITYELAKQLKETGFPEIIQSRKTYLPYCNPDGSDDPKNGELICEPNLHELIEACGDRFLCLGKETDEAEHRKWLAISTILKEDKRPIMSTSIWDYNVGILKDMEREHGQTPEEAVAKLWLKLNEKK